MWTKRRQDNLAQAAVGWDASPISIGRWVAEVYAQIKNDDFSLVSGTFYQGSVSATGCGTSTSTTTSAATAARTASAKAYRSAIGAAIAARDQGRYSVNFNGDGDFMVAPGSLWTASHHKVPLLTVVHNNRAWHQETMHLQRMASRRERGPEKARTGTLITEPEHRLREVRGIDGRVRRGPDHAAGSARAGASRARSKW